MNLAFDITLILIILGILCWQTFTITKKRQKNLIKKRRYFTKKNESGVYYEEDENGKITKHENK